MMLIPSYFAKMNKGSVDIRQVALLARLVAWPSSEFPQARMGSMSILFSNLPLLSQAEGHLHVRGWLHADLMVCDSRAEKDDAEGSPNN